MTKSEMNKINIMKRKKVGKGDRENMVDMSDISTKKIAFEQRVEGSKGPATWLHGGRASEEGGTESKKTIRGSGPPC